MERGNTNQTKKRNASSGKRFGGINAKNKGVGTIGSMILANGGSWGWSYTPSKNKRSSYIAQIRAARKRREIKKHSSK
jgi:hypothetical protein